MRSEIAFEMELICAKGVQFLDNALGLLYHQIEVMARNLTRDRARSLIDKQHFRPQRRHHARALRRIALRHHRDEWITLDRTHYRKTGAGVPAGQLNDGLSGLERAISFGIIDHLEGYPVLLGKPRIEVVELRKNSTFDATGYPSNIYKWGAAYGFDDR